MSKLKFYKEVFENLEVSTSVTIGIYLYAFIRVIMALFAEDKMTSLLTTGVIIILLCVLKAIADSIVSVISDVRDTANMLKDAKVLHTDYKDCDKLMSVLEEAGEYEVAGYIKKAAPTFTCIGKYTASLACHKRITVLYPPILSKWYVCIEDLENHTTCSYFGRE